MAHNRTIGIADRHTGHRTPIRSTISISRIECLCDEPAGSLALVHPSFTLRLRHLGGHVDACENLSFAFERLYP